MNFRQRYRPNRFSEIVGNKKVIRILKNMIKSHRIPNGILFHGPPGSGKTTLTRIFVKALLCQNFSNDVCSKCKKCLSFSDKLVGGDDYSFHDCSQITARELEGIINGFRLVPISTTKINISIFDEFHRTREPLQDKLLIPLEKFTDILLIFCLIDLKAVSDAFRQRVTVLKTVRPDIDQLIPWLQRICTSERITIKDSNAVREVAQCAARLPRECLSLLEKISLSGEPLTTSLVREFAQDIQPVSDDITVLD